MQLCDFHTLSNALSEYFAVLAGPSFAAEIMEGQPTNVVVASQSSEVANKVAQYVSGKL